LKLRALAEYELATGSDRWVTSARRTDNRSVATIENRIGCSSLWPRIGVVPRQPVAYFITDSTCANRYALFMLGIPRFRPFLAGPDLI
jgi:hypothetical protein